MLPLAGLPSMGLGICHLSKAWLYSLLSRIYDQMFLHWWRGLFGSRFEKKLEDDIWVPERSEGIPFPISTFTSATIDKEGAWSRIKLFLGTLGNLFFVVGHPGTCLHSLLVHKIRSILHVHPGWDAWAPDGGSVPSVFQIGAMVLPWKEGSFSSSLLVLTWFRPRWEEGKENTMMLFVGQLRQLSNGHPSPHPPLLRLLLVVFLLPRYAFKIGRFRAFVVRPCLHWCLTVSGWSCSIHRVGWLVGVTEYWRIGDTGTSYALFTYTFTVPVKAFFINPYLNRIQTCLG